MWLAPFRYCVEYSDQVEGRHDGNVYYEYFYNLDVATRYVEKLKDGKYKLAYVKLSELVCNEIESPLKGETNDKQN